MLDVRLGVGTHPSEKAVRILEWIAGGVLLEESPAGRVVGAREGIDEVFRVDGSCAPFLAAEEFFRGGRRCR